MSTFAWIMIGGLFLGIALLFISVTMKKPKPILAIVSFILIFVCGFAGVLAPNAEPNENPDEAPQVEEKTEDEVDTSVTFEQIYRAYKENELQADTIYKNNRYRVTAKINTIDSDGLFNFTGGATLTMEYKTGNTIVVFYAEFEREQEDALKKVKVGDTITFEGECLSAGSWSDCEIIGD